MAPPRSANSQPRYGTATNHTFKIGMMRIRDSRLLGEQRRRKILDVINQRGQITVREVVQRFDVSAVTARGDLDALCAEDLAVRSHGGAVRKLEVDSRVPSDSVKSKQFAEVAELANVSLSMVLRVANGNDRIEPAVRSSVFAAARQLGISLAPGPRNRTIAFVLGNRDTVNEFQSKILVGAEGYCAQHDWDLQFMCFRSELNAPGGPSRLPDALVRPNRPSGAILTGTHSASTLSALIEKRIPFSLVGNNVVGDWDPRQYDCVFTDDVRGSIEITRHLIAEGHKKIWYIGNRRLPWFARCADGYSKAMKEADLEPHFSEISSEDRELGYLAVKALLASGQGQRALCGHGSSSFRGVSRSTGVRNQIPMTLAWPASTTRSAKFSIQGLPLSASFQRNWVNIWQNSLSAHPRTRSTPTATSNANRTHKA